MTLDTLTAANRQLSERVAELEALVQRYATCGHDHSTQWWQIRCEDLQALLAEVERERDWWHGNCAAEKVARQMRESERDTLQRENAELMQENKRLTIGEIDHASQQARAAGLREALEYAAHCAIERNGTANDLPKGDQRRTWVECKESEAVRIRDWCQRRLKQIEAQAGEVG